MRRAKVVLPDPAGPSIEMVLVDGNFLGAILNRVRI